MDRLAQNVAALPINYKKPLKFCFVVLPEGPEYAQAVGLPVECGMCEVPIKLDENYPLSLAVDEPWFRNGFDKIDLQSEIGLTHELAHIIHGGYFRNLAQVSEGFAELLPHYLMNFETKNLKHQQAIANFNETEMQTLDFVNQNGMFAREEINGRETQQLKSYMSVYLWMLAYTKRLEKLYQKDKFETTNLMLEKFEPIDQLQNWHDKSQALAELVKLSPNELMNGITLQKEGKQHIMEIITNAKLRSERAYSR